MANQSSSKSSLIGSSKSSSIQLNESQKKIIDMIDSNSKVTQEQIANEIQISNRAVQKNIKELVDKGIVKRFDSDRSGYWEIL